jgi:hypothetical protein
MNAPRFITLTQIADESSWEARYASLASAFRTLRTHRAWRSRVTGGIYATETTFNQSTSRWHVHMHCVVDGDFFPQKLLSEEWAKASGGSKIVDIRAIHDREKAATYIAKYVGKPSQPENWPAAKICEYALQSKGKRTWHTFGKLHNLKISDDLPDDGQKTEQVLCGTQRLMAEARKGCGDSLRACMLLSKLGPSVAKSVGVQVEEAVSWYRPLDDAEHRFVIETCAVVYARHVEHDKRDWSASARKEALARERAKQRMLFVTKLFDGG